jgi:hypothetical protein
MVSFKDPQPCKAVLAGRGISNRELARITGQAEWWVSKALNGHVPIPPEFADQVAELLGLPAADLFSEDDDRPPRLITLESDIRAFVEASRLAAGLPPRITDSIVLGKVAQLLAATGRKEVI